MISNPRNRMVTCPIVESRCAEHSPARSVLRASLSVVGGNGLFERRLDMKFFRFAGIVVLIGLLVGCTGRPDGIEPVTGFDINRYQGTWYEIMRLDHSFERGLSNVTATYTLLDDGEVRVVNRGFDAEDCQWDEAVGTAEFQGRSDVASLSVTFQWPFAGGYHVFELDEANYEYALVAGPNRDFLWLLARTPDLAETKRTRLVARAKDAGFPVDELIRVDHRKSDCTPKN